jgi:hypothetical protein
MVALVERHKLVKRSNNVLSYTHVKDTARFDYIYRWAIFVDTTKDGTTTEWSYGRVEGICLYIKAYAVRQRLHHKVVRLR